MEPKVVLPQRKNKKKLKTKTVLVFALGARMEIFGGQKFGHDVMIF